MLFVIFHLQSYLIELTSDRSHIHTNGRLFHSVCCFLPQAVHLVHSHISDQILVQMCL